MKRFQLFRSDGDEGGEPVAVVEIDEETGNPLVIEEIEGEEQAPKFGVQDFERFLEENPEVAARFQTEQKPAFKANEEPKGLDLTAYIDDDGNLDVAGMSVAVQRAIEDTENRAFKRGVETVQAEFGPTMAELAIDTFADRVAREHELGAAGRERLVQDLKTMNATPSQLRNIPAPMRKLLIDAAQTTDRMQNVQRDNAAPGGKMTRTTSYTLAIPDPTNMGWAGYCRQVGWEPNDPAAIKRGKERGILK